MLAELNVTESFNHNTLLVVMIIAYNVLYEKGSISLNEKV